MYPAVTRVCDRSQQACTANIGDQRLRFQFSQHAPLRSRPGKSAGQLLTVQPLPGAGHVFVKSHLAEIVSPVSESGQQFWPQPHHMMSLAPPQSVVVLHYTSLDWVEDSRSGDVSILQARTTCLPL
jgi:hypothetical protein